MARRGGGPAFPTSQQVTGGPQPLTEQIDGLSLRDYFAAHGDAPSHAELVVSVQGFVQAVLVYDGAADTVTVNGAAPVPWGAWWAGLSQSRRVRALADVRYLHADAMLIVRDL
jgi:hypothetical protein